MRYVVALIIAFALVTPAFAHRLLFNLRVDGGELKIEAYYEDETLAGNAKVALLQGETVVAEGRTDERGAWSCPAPPPGVYQIRVDDVGHVTMQSLVINADTQFDDKPGTQWGKLAIGVGIIVALTVLWLVARRPFRKRAPTPTTS